MGNEPDENGIFDRWFALNQFKRGNQTPGEDNKARYLFNLPKSLALTTCESPHPIFTNFNLLK
ncbi:MAG: hypothetical protein SH848_17190 [Saprospiraceae bacterium]|nr:hypothetical protein [Saprospiraceae bacterium]MDZ4705665.1 hypothetical protein [Saprospiraceae bacterium]